MRIVFILLLGLAASSAWSENLIVTLQAPSRPQQRTEPVTFELLVLNPGPDAATYQPLADLAGTLRNEANTWVANLHAVTAVSAQQIAPGQFARITYRMDLPSDISGRLVLDVPELETVRAVLDVSSANPEAPVKGEPEAPILAAAEPPNVSRIDRAFSGHFAIHEPIYFIYGPKAPAAKFQFSFKYRLTGEANQSSLLVPAIRGLYFAYSQRSLWDLDAKSSPFYDTSYMPELFYEWLAPGKRGPDSGFHWLGLQTGYQHESNGKDGDDSRSLNTLYARVGFVIGPLSGWHAIISPKAYYYLDVSDEIAKYRGYGDLTVALARNDSTQLSITARAAQARGKGSTQFDLTQPVNIPWINLNAYLHFQYFRGYGESLLNYNQRSSIWRAGFAFAR
jgi:outer membrane phospholipase A